MEKAIKHCFGVDISKADFAVTLATSYFGGRIEYSKSVKFTNNKSGFNQLIKWGKKLVAQDVYTFYLMEATGIYYEPLAYHLTKIQKQVSVVLPNKVKHFGKSLNIKTKTDLIDSKVIARFGIERHHPNWSPPLPIFKELRDLSRLYVDLKQQRTVITNRNESAESGAVTNKFIVHTNNRLVKEIDKQVVRCKNRISTLVSANSQLKDKVDKLQTIKGVGFITIVIIIAETQGFALIRNRKQLASYAGYDVIQRESGTSVKGKTRISKKGNSRIRAALHFPALVSSRFNTKLKEDYHRIIANKSSKMIGMTALQRKLLLLIYTLWKKDEIYNESF